MDVKKAAVVGGGTMGNGIAHVFAMNDISVTLIETKQEFADRALATIQKNLDRMVKKEKIDEAKMKATLSNITISLDLADGIKDADLVVEAVPENFDIKRSVWQTIDEAAPKHAILGSNTSSISITKLAALTSRPEKFIGMHFFNPVPVMKLVEIVRGLQTDDETYQVVEETSKKIGKVPVPVNDAPGFVSNRVLMPMINEAIFCVGEGVATPEKR